MKPSDNQLAEMRKWLAKFAGMGAEVADLEAAVLTEDLEPHEAIKQGLERVLAQNKS